MGGWGSFMEHLENCVPLRDVKLQQSINHPLQESILNVKTSHNASAKERSSDQNTIHISSIDSASLPTLEHSVMKSWKPQGHDCEWRQWSWAQHQILQSGPMYFLFAIEVDAKLISLRIIPGNV